jgi:hypothetical protein
MSTISTKPASKSTKSANLHHLEQIGFLFLGSKVITESIAVNQVNLLLDLAAALAHLISQILLALECLVFCVGKLSR